MGAVKWRLPPSDREKKPMVCGATVCSALELNYYSNKNGIGANILLERFTYSNFCAWHYRSHEFYFH